MKIGARFTDLKEIKKIFPKSLQVIGVGVSAFQRSGLGYILPNYEILSLLETNDLAAIRQICPVTIISGERPEKLNTSSILKLESVKKFLTRQDKFFAPRYRVRLASKNLPLSASNSNLVNLFVYKAATPLDPIIADLGVRLLSAPGYIRKPLEDKKVFREEAQKAGIQIPRGVNLNLSELTENKWDQLKQEYGDPPSGEAGQLVFQLTDYSTGGGQGTFFIQTKKDWEQFQEFINSPDRKKELKFVNVCERIEGKAASITGCATKYGVVTGILQTQIVDQPELVGFRGRSGVWLGHDWNVRFSEEAQLSAERLCKKWGEYIYQKGYKGIFGLDVIVDKNDKITVIECNSRYTGAFPVYTMLQLSQGEMPLDVWHLLEWLGLDYEMDINEVQKVSRRPKQGSHLILHNREDEEILPKNQIQAGIYEFSTRQTKFSSFSQLPQSRRVVAGEKIYLPASIQFMRSGFSLMDLKAENEFVLCDRMPNKNQLVKPGERMGKLIFKRRIIDDKGNLLPEIKELVKAVYKGFDLKKI